MAIAANPVLPSRAAHDAPLVIDAQLARKYGGDGPRYISYPTVDRFVEAFDAGAYRHWLANRSIGGFARPLGVYVHVAFGNTYADFLAREAGLVAQALGGDRKVARLRWGGTPTLLGDGQSARLMQALRAAFDLDPDGEYTIEIDSRAVNRSGGVAETRAAIEAARANGFRSVDMGVVHGMPRQTAAGFMSTLERVLECAPDRIALHSCSHLPAPLDLMMGAIRRLERAGFEHIGMDQFTRAGGELAVAKRGGRLARDFQRYSAGGDNDLIGLGVAAVGRIGPACVQNAKSLEDYCARLDAGELPVLRGIELKPDDLARRGVIQALACDFAVSKEAIGIAHLLDFDRYFATELAELRELAANGLVEIGHEWIHVTPPGRLLVRVVCMVFDRYLRETRDRARYSRVM